MATGQTIGHNLPYPLSTDPVNVHGDIKALADRLEIVISAISSLPSQTGNAGKFLKTDGYVTSWASIPTTSAATPTTLGTVFGSTTYSGNDPESLSLGYLALQSDNSAYGFNTAIGHYSLMNPTGGGGNTAIGMYAGSDVTTSEENIFIGQYAGEHVTTGSWNTVIGSKAGSITTTGTDNVIIGAYAEASSPTASKEITLGSDYGGTNRFRIPGMEIDWSYVISDETTTVPSAPTATTNYELTTDRNVRYHTVNATNNWVLNLRGNDVTTYDNVSLINKAVTIVFMNTNGATAYYPTAFKIDGTTRTVKWQGGSAPTSGNTNSIDVYTYTIIKTAVNTYTVLGSQTKFA